MSERKQIGWIASQEGTVTKYTPPAKVAAPKTRTERHAQYRQGLQHVLKLMTEAGFYCNAMEQSTTALSFQRGKLMFDVSLREPGNIAYVTSHVGYDPKKGNARIITAADVVDSDYLVQVIASKEGGSSTMPVYIPLPKSLTEPAKYVAVNVVKTMQTMVGYSAELKGVLDHLESRSQDSIDSGSPGV